LEWIEKDGRVSLWEDSGANSAGWKKTLAKLKGKLESPMRSEKRMEMAVGSGVLSQLYRAALLTADELIRAAFYTETN